ncbi:MGMT family protein [Bacteroidia bacterium]|jgi:methylated-DNA-protein-cysteine methyltransferase related protein|nr:MGMT family protein [Bacteroidia bacterium]
MNKFYSDVFDVVRLIPKGRATSYGAIAKYLGAVRSSRLVGYAMNTSHSVIPSIPAHRVVNRNGLLTGKAHFNPPERMQNRLEEEGVRVIKDQIQNWDEVFWDPSIHLAL